jgi:nitroimidazol reductase NimA-like FMN-containing flavoprotein (pyridoxamine 5'-phosphate oxidase superfamily)
MVVALLLLPVAMLGALGFTIPVLLLTVALVVTDIGLRTGFAAAVTAGAVATVGPGTGEDQVADLLVDLHMQRRRRRRIHGKGESGGSGGAGHVSASKWYAQILGKWLFRCNHFRHRVPRRRLQPENDRTMSATPPSARTRVKRVPKRGLYDRETIDAILDAGMVCHVGYVIDGAPYVTPTLYWREGDHVYWHGSSASRMLRKSDGAPVCLTVTHIDGLVMARSAFHHSVNYRSVVVHGTARPVTDPAERQRAFTLVVDHVLPGRAGAWRPPSGKEAAATACRSGTGRGRSQPRPCVGGLSTRACRRRNSSCGNDDAGYDLIKFRVRHFFRRALVVCVGRAYCEEHRCD